VPYRRKKLTFAISSPDEFLYYLSHAICYSYGADNNENTLAVCGSAQSMSRLMTLYVASMWAMMWLLILPRLTDGSPMLVQHGRNTEQTHRSTF